VNRKEFLKLTAWLAGGAAGLPLTMGDAVAAATTGSLADRLGQTVGDGDFWRVVKNQFLLDPEWAYLNFGGLGSSPMPVINTLLEYTRAEERMPNVATDQKLWELTKTRLARILGKTCRMEDLALVSTATEGINLIVSGLPLQRGDEVITSTHEHVALVAALLNRQQRDGIVVRAFEPDRERGLGNVERIAQLITNRTKLIFHSHVTCTTGQRFPEKAIAALARSKGIWYALDGAQAPVCVPFDIVDCGADFYACSTHKWVMGPKRTGFLYVRQGMLDLLRPMALGIGTTEKCSLATGEIVLHPTARRFEWGTQNDGLLFGLGAAAEFIETIGLERIWQHNHALAERFRREALEIPGVEIVSPKEEVYRTAMISFRMSAHPYTDIMESMGKQKIRVRPVTEGGLNAIRVSFHICNDDGDVTRIIDAMKKLAAG
jgi:selenocysteine lyase/cysteine desulfurase